MSGCRTCGVGFVIVPGDECHDCAWRKISNRRRVEDAGPYMLAALKMVSACIPAIIAAGILTERDTKLISSAIAKAEETK